MFVVRFDRVVSGWLSMNFVSVLTFLLDGSKNVLGSLIIAFLAS